MLVKSVLVRPQGLRPRARAPTCPPPLLLLRHWQCWIKGERCDYKPLAPVKGSSST